MSSNLTSQSCSLPDNPVAHQIRKRYSQLTQHMNPYIKNGQMIQLLQEALLEIDRLQESLNVESSIVQRSER